MFVNNNIFVYSNVFLASRRAVTITIYVFLKRKNASVQRYLRKSKKKKIPEKLFFFSIKSFIVIVTLISFSANILGLICLIYSANLVFSSLYVRTLPYYVMYCTIILAVVVVGSSN